MSNTVLFKSTSQKQEYFFFFNVEEVDYINQSTPFVDG